MPQRPAPEWVAPEPRALPSLREALADQMRNPVEHHVLSMTLSTGKGTVNPDYSNPERAARLLLADERQRLTDASLYSVTGEMAMVARQAGAKLPPFVVKPEHVPTTSGFMVFGQPIGSYVGEGVLGGDEDSGEVLIVAVSWGPSRLVQHVDGHLWVTFWSVTDHVEAIRRFREGGMSPEEAFRAEYAARADLTWDNEVLINYGSSNIKVAGRPEPVDLNDITLAAHTTAAWMQTVRATWLLCNSAGSKIAEVTDEHMPRTVRRKAERGGFSNADAVKVVRLHDSRKSTTRESVPDGRGGSTVTVRSVVSGHVRMQPYPSRGTVEPIWIEPYIRGPRDAPFKEAPIRVNLLDRLPPRGDAGQPVR